MQSDTSINTGSWKTKLNAYWLGILLGLIIPPIIAMLIYLYKYHHINIGLYFAYPSLFSPLLQLGGIGNLGLFFFFQHHNMMKAQRGIIISTILIAVIVLCIKYF